MKVLVFLAFLALVATPAFVQSHAGHDHDDHEHDDANAHVLVLTDSTFDEEIAKSPLSLVEFYAPWCGHCKKLAPEFEDAAHRLEGKAVLAKVDCTVEKICDKFDVRGYPTIKIFRNDGSQPSEYPGGRTADAITKFMEKQLSPAFVEINDEEALKAFSETEGELAVAGFFAEASGEAYEAFLKTAQTLRNEYAFAVVTKDAANLGSKYGVSSVPSVVVFKHFDEPDATYSDEFTTEALTDFINAEAFPLFGEIGPENYQQYLDRGFPLIWCFIDKTKDVTKDVIANIIEVAKTFKGKISFVNLDGVRWAEHAKNFGLSGATPGIVIEDREGGKNYVFPQSAEAPAVDALTNHVQGFLDGTLAPTVKSAEPPAENNGPVKIVVGKTFDEIVMDDSKDVFVEFYAPWCGHCKSLAPKWEKLGEEFVKSGESNIVIAKVDATENDTPAKIRGFPTLIFYPAGQKSNPVTYSGERSHKDMVAFVRKHAKGGASTATETKSGHDEL